MSDAVGTWAESNGTTFVLNKNGTFVYAGNQPGTWKVTADALVLTWNKGRVDTYKKRDGDAIQGDSTSGRKVGIRKTR